ncbi:MAG: cell division protein FtsQ/DivIB [Pseudomonadota bacterium]
MPSVKAAKKKPAKSAKAKTRKSSKTAKGTSTRPVPYNDIILSRVGGVGAAVFGAAIFVVVGVLWVGGYIGQFFDATARATDRQVAAMMVAAGFGIDDITVVGRQNTSMDTLENAIGPVVGTSIAHFDPHAARARVEALGWVRAVSVSRLWPGRINVSIREREPAAVWQMAGAFRLVDADGVVIREIGTLEYAGLPHIVGVGAPTAAAEILGVLRTLPVLQARTTSLVRASNRRWDLHIDGHTIVRLPEFDFADAVRELAVLDETVGVLDHSFEYIDFRDAERVYFKCEATRLEPPGPDDRKGSLTVRDLLADGFSCPLARVTG